MKETNQHMFLWTKMLRCTEKAALACYKWIGKLDEKNADHAAVQAMRTELNNLDLISEIVIGEGERDNSPMLFIGERFGRSSQISPNILSEIAIAVDPLECTSLCARGERGSISVIAAAEYGGLLKAPDCYMEKIAFGSSVRTAGLKISLDSPLKENIKTIAIAKGIKISDVKVCILERPRNVKLITETLEVGAQLILIKDGDINAAISTCMTEVTVNAPDIYVGIGGAPEGVIAAAAIKCLGGEIYGKLLIDNQIQLEKAKKMGIENIDRILSSNDMAPGKLCCIAITGVTNNDLTKDGIEIKHCSKTGQIFTCISSLIIDYASRAVVRITRSKRFLSL